MRKSLMIMALIIVFIVTVIATFAFISESMEHGTTPDHSEFSRSSVAITSADGNRTCFYVEIADTSEKQATGLMNRTTLPQDTGMLFVFGKDAARHFWMDNTRIPLDMIFISSNYHIVDVHENAVPYDRTLIASAAPCKYVLEINGGLCRTLNIRTGDTVSIDLG